MKKVLTFISLFCISFSMLAQEDGKPDGYEMPQEFAVLRTAAELATLGYKTYSPTALIEAARILASTGYVATDIELVQSIQTENEVEEKDSAVTYDPMQLLLDAEKFAGKDRTLLALIKKTKKDVVKILKLKEETQQRGAEGGPYRIQSRVRGVSYDKYTRRFLANQIASVSVSGDGDTDLDLYIYDMEGNLVTKDDSYSPHCYCNWIPSLTNSYIIKIVNRGRMFNDALVVTN